MLTYFQTFFITDSKMVVCFLYYMNYILIFPFRVVLS